MNQNSQSFEYILEQALDLYEQGFSAASILNRFPAHRKQLAEVFDYVAALKNSRESFQAPHVLTQRILQALPRTTQHGIASRTPLSWKYFAMPVTVFAVLVLAMLRFWSTPAGDVAFEPTTFDQAGQEVALRAVSQKDATQDIESALEAFSVNMGQEETLAQEESGTAAEGDLLQDISVDYESF